MKMQKKMSAIIIAIQENPKVLKGSWSFVFLQIIEYWNNQMIMDCNTANIRVAKIRNSLYFI